MQWDRNTAGRLERLGASIEEGCEVSLHINQMETPPEEQQSQKGVHWEPNAYISIRDHIHPPRVSAPSCIIPPAKDVAVRSYLVPLLPTFHVMENENSYTHIRDFEEVCTTFKEGAFDMDLLKLKAFPLTLKDKAKIWLNSLRPRTIRNWAELIMTPLFHFEDRVHRRSLPRAKSLPLLFPRLLRQVLEHIGFPAEPRIERRSGCEATLTIDRWQARPRAFHLPSSGSGEDESVDDSPRGDLSPIAEHAGEPLAPVSPLSPPVSSAPPAIPPVAPASVS